MMEKIKLSEVERGLPNGIIAQIRGLNTQGEGILEPLDSFLSDILCARGSFIYNSQEVKITSRNLVCISMGTP